MIDNATDIKVVKFGGSSLADAKQFKKVADIILSDPKRVFVVASAPGKRDDADDKVTDLLLRCHNEAATENNYTAALTQSSASLSFQSPLTGILRSFVKSSTRAAPRTISPAAANT